MIVDLLVYGTWMAGCCLGCCSAIIYGKGRGNLGGDCNSSYNESCNAVYRARAVSFSTMTWCALFLAWEVMNLRRSFFNMHPETESPYTQWFRDIWSNKFLFWSVIFEFLSDFPVVYIPVINDRVFLQKGIGYE
ncbi:LAMI_0B08944g1_1 [Lachancea mirantina]|uniref:LAMI_0B08944g1_1 n=1 Tax=Lachancea mirantina TaxID=1230905 RepID=A0A1G4IY59_9SACH|nr:LAMI_0B08944g1_1 [Lachancea mirantina]